MGEGDGSRARLTIAQPSHLSSLLPSFLASKTRMTATTAHVPSSCRGSTREFTHSAQCRAQGVRALDKRQPLSFSLPSTGLALATVLREETEAGSHGTGHRAV